MNLALVDVELGSSVADIEGCCLTIFVGACSSITSSSVGDVSTDYFSCTFSKIMSSLLALLEGMLVFSSFASIASSDKIVFE